MSFSIGEATSEWAQRSGLTTWFEEQTSSTNLIAKENPLSEVPAIELYVTEHQTAGRGRGDHQWNESPDIGGALLSSWVFPRASAPSPILSPLIGLAVMKAFHQTWPFLDWNLKAPNDLYVGDKKIAGLLIENIEADKYHRFIVGFGFNVFTQPGLSTATHLAHELHKHSDQLAVTLTEWTSVLDRMLLELTLVASRSDQTLTQTDCASLLWALNRHPLLKEKYLGLSPDGSLQTQTQYISWSEL